MAIGFGAANSVFSMLAYFLVENKEDQRADTEISTNLGDDRYEMDNLSQESLPGTRNSSQDHLPNTNTDDEGNNEKTYPSETVTPKRLSAINAHVRFEQQDAASETASVPSIPDYNNQDSQSEHDTLYEFKGSSTQLRGRRFLLLVSLAGGMVTLLITSLCFNIHPSSPGRMPLIAFFIYVFTLFYSVGAGSRGGC